MLKWPKGKQFCLKKFEVRFFFIQIWCNERVFRTFCRAFYLETTFKTFLQWNRENIHSFSTCLWAKIIHLKKVAFVSNAKWKEFVILSKHYCRKVCATLVVSLKSLFVFWCSNTFIGYLTITYDIISLPSSFIVKLKLLFTEDILCFNVLCLISKW